MRLILAVLAAWTAASVVQATWRHRPLHAIIAIVLAVVIDIVIFSWRRADG